MHLPLIWLCSAYTSALDMLLHCIFPIHLCPAYASAPQMHLLFCWLFCWLLCWLSYWLSC
jgi:hypothetical protein